MPQTDPAERMADAVQQLADDVHTIHATLHVLVKSLQALVRLLPWAYGVLLLVAVLTCLGTWLMIRDIREGHTALLKMIDQSAANQAEMLRRLHPQP